MHSLEDRSEVAGILLFMLGSSEHVLVWSTQILKYVQAHVATYLLAQLLDVRKKPGLYLLFGFIVAGLSWVFLG